MNIVAPIKEVIINSYINGIHSTLEKEKILVGFHKDFKMIVRNDSTLENVSVYEWIDLVKKMRKDNPQLWDQETKYEFIDIIVKQDIATAILKIHKGNTYFSTDMMLLYRIDGSWKIVSKIYSIL